MNKKIIILFLVFFHVGVSAQFSINYSVGYGTYEMNDLKELSKNVFQEIENMGMFPDAIRLVDNYPGYITHHIDLLYKVKAHEVGLKASYLTTGSKIAYADYSGRYAGKMITNGYKAGVVYRGHFFRTYMSKSCLLSLFGEISPSAIFSSFKVEEKLFVIWDDIYTEIPMDKVERINKTAFSVQPLLGGRFELYNHYLFTLSGGYDFAFGGKITNGVRFNWSGIRINAGIGYLF